MPQLDKITFFTQVSWLIIVFFSLYIVLVKFILPKLALILKLRQRSMNKFLIDGYNFKKEAEINVSTYFEIFYRFTIKSNKSLSNLTDKFYLYEEINKIYLLQGSSVAFFNKEFFNELTSFQIKKIFASKK